MYTNVLTKRNEDGLGLLRQHEHRIEEPHAYPLCRQCVEYRPLPAQLPVTASRHQAVARLRARPIKFVDHVCDDLRKGVHGDRRPGRVQDKRLKRIAGFEQLPDGLFNARPGRGKAEYSAVRTVEEVRKHLPGDPRSAREYDPSAPCFVYRQRPEKSARLSKTLRFFDCPVQVRRHVAIRGRRTEGAQDTLTGKIDLDLFDDVQLNLRGGFSGACRGGHRGTGYCSNFGRRLIGIIAETPRLMAGETDWMESGI